MIVAGMAELELFCKLYGVDYKRVERIYNNGSKQNNLGYIVINIVINNFIIKLKIENGILEPFINISIQSYSEPYNTFYTYKIKNKRLYELNFNKVLNEDQLRNVIASTRLLETYDRNINDTSYTIKKFKKTLQDRYKAKKMLSPSSMENLTEGDLVDGINWLYDLDFDRDIFSKTNENTVPLYKILKVKTLKDDTRVAIADKVTLVHDTEEASGGWYNRKLVSERVNIVNFDITSSLYNYLDEGAYISPNSNFVIRYDVKGKISEELVPVLSKFADHLLKSVTGPIVFDDTTINRAIKYSDRLYRDDQKSLTYKKTVKLKWQKRLENLKLGKILYINGLEMSKHVIKYKGQIISSNLLSVYNLLLNFTRYRDINDLNFDELFDQVIGLMSITREGIFQIGDVGITIKAEITNFNVERRRMFINGIRINNGEVKEVLHRTLGYNDQESYNKFLTEVSKCSLVINDKLINGLFITLDDFYSSNLVLNLVLNLKRIKNKNYLIFKDNLYKIKNSAALFRIENSSTLSEVLDILKNPSIVEGLNSNKVINQILYEGMKKFKLKKESENTLLENIIKKHNIEISEGIHRNGNKITGYLIQGRNSSYLINKDPLSNFEVFRYPNMRYICMIDKEANKSPGVNGLISRIYALLNDSVFSTAIPTLGEVEDDKN